MEVNEETFKKKRRLNIAKCQVASRMSFKKMPLDLTIRKSSLVLIRTVWPW